MPRPRAQPAQAQPAQAQPSPAQSILRLPPLGGIRPTLEEIETATNHRQLEQYRLTLETWYQYWTAATMQLCQLYNHKEIACQAKVNADDVLQGLIRVTERQWEMMMMMEGTVVAVRER